MAIVMHDAFGIFFESLGRVLVVESLDLDHLVPFRGANALSLVLSLARAIRTPRTHAFLLLNVFLRALTSH